jgi:16S rRNA (guanine527-N7)-methyltransferase
VISPLAALGDGATRILGRELSPEQIEAFARYLQILAKWQKVSRLVGSADPGWIVEHLFLDSLLFLKVLPEKARSVLDVGSGAGVPGIPIKIARPWITLTLVESRRRRASFLQSAVREIGLEGVRILNVRADTLVGTSDAGFDAVVFRCAGELSSMFPLARRLVAPGGVILGSGPPSPRFVAEVEWVEVERTPGQTRLFALSRG